MEYKINSYRFIFPEAANDNNTLFGGLAIKWIDEVAYITATRYTKKQMVPYQ